MTRTTPERPVDVERVIPELVGFRAAATRLHPRPGSPTVNQSSIRGPLLWPAGEAWPVCREQHRRDRGERLEHVHEVRRILAAAAH